MLRIDLYSRLEAPLPYRRYLKFQEGLRARRREALIFCEHPPTITAGVQARPGNLLADPESLVGAGIDLVSVRRGGEHTAHEPGQCLIYAHLDLRQRGLGLASYFRILLEAAAAAVHEVWRLPTRFEKSRPGLYLEDGSKLASIGVELKSFFTSHGVALNVDNDLQTFRWINPCGELDARMSSVAAAGGDPSLRLQFTAAFQSAFQRALPQSTALSRPP